MPVLYSSGYLRGGALDARSPKGGGGGGGGGRGGGRGSSGSGSKGGKSGSGSSSSSTPIVIPGGSAKSSTYSNGGGATTTISSGPFAGRKQGGGYRLQIYGSSMYGSGYPGYRGRGVTGRDFPFYFWAIAFGIGYQSAPYIDEGRREFGSPDNSSRPGGAETTVSFASASRNTTLWVVADNMTTMSLIDEVYSKCASSLSNSTSRTVVAYSDNPRAESIVQYYRASSVALALNGYNNTAALSNDDNATATPLPEWRDTTMLNCVNTTIGAAVPLVNAAGGNCAMTMMSAHLSLGAGVAMIWVLVSLV
ncbi:hypothetical protein GGG16DRAFT_28458, partial [Schizophyllum commune]